MGQNFKIEKPLSYLALHDLFLITRHIIANMLLLTNFRPFLFSFSPSWFEIINQNQTLNTIDMILTEAECMEIGKAATG